MRIPPQRLDSRRRHVHLLGQLHDARLVSPAMTSDHHVASKPEKAHRIVRRENSPSRFEPATVSSRPQKVWLVIATE